MSEKAEPLQHSVYTEKFFPQIEPYDTGYIRVSDVHELYYEQCGKRDGNPIVYVHGGPGCGVSEDNRQFFDPDVYRIILFDQRGAGKSRPVAELKDNTTWDLVADMEKLRKHLGIETWIVFGGSWGSTLSLVYAETHPDSVKALIVRGIFTLRRRELQWFYQDGASFLFPDFWEKYIEPIPESERGDLMSAYYKRLTGDNEAEKLMCAKSWSQWELGTLRLYPDYEFIEKMLSNPTFALQFARIECHFFMNKGFFETDSYVLDNVDKIRHIPTTIIQGRYDVVCPPATAWELHKRFPEAEFHLVPDAGHFEHEAGILHHLVQATNKYKHL